MNEINILFERSMRYAEGEGDMDPFQPEDMRKLEEESIQLLTLAHLIWVLYRRRNHES